MLEIRRRAGEMVDASSPPTYLPHWIRSLLSNEEERKPSLRILPYPEPLRSPLVRTFSSLVPSTSTKSVDDLRPDRKCTLKELWDRLAFALPRSAYDEALTAIMSFPGI